jgi:hypothetical protein
VTTRVGRTGKQIIPARWQLLTVRRSGSHFIQGARRAIRMSTKQGGAASACGRGLSSEVCRTSARNESLRPKDKTRSFEGSGLSIPGFVVGVLVDKTSMPETSHRVGKRSTSSRSDDNGLPLWISPEPENDSDHPPGQRESSKVGNHLHSNPCLGAGGCRGPFLKLLWLRLLRV